MQKKDKHNLGEIAVLQRSLCDSREEYNLANARDKGMLQNELDTSRIVIERLKKEIERMSLDNWKNEPIIPSNASNEEKRAIFPLSTGQPLPSKPV